jgi:hypothetical protein
MTSVKMVLVNHEGVLGFVVSENSFGAWVCWYVDGLRYESFLEEEEYVVKFIGEIYGE